MKQDAYTMSLLFDYYGELLTEKQRTCFDLYYNQDLSLSEIAEEAGITRQGVHDTLLRAEALLQNMEKTTGCIAKAERLASGLATIEAVSKELLSEPQSHDAAQTILEAVAQMKE